MKLDEFVLTAKTRLNQLFQVYLHDIEHPAAELQKAINYAVQGGGKCIRPLFVYLTGHALNAPWENLDVPASAIELIHVYSLIHDDLPAMDNSDLRRGKPTCHKAFNEAIAILAGDALQPLAFEIITQHPASLSPKQRVDMIYTLSYASGIRGMAAGQALDLQGTNSLDSLTEMYQLKTSTLLAASIKLGAIAANNNDPDTHHSLQRFADCIGLAFQIQDDLLDIEGATQHIGKPQGLDQANQKITYPSLVGIEESRQQVETLFTTALQSIAFLKERGKLLEEFAYSLLHRKK
ncbi:MAG: hypothetical protein ACD_60C00091G0015 [uncultured bacterium]|nr:MAG: hypothetical protein ACD_60C00091G0015 [uncultured bacterium]